MTADRGVIPSYWWYAMTKVRAPAAEPRKKQEKSIPRDWDKIQRLRFVFGDLEKTKQILDGYVSWQLDFLINHASIRDCQIHVVGIDTVLVHPTLVPTDCFHGATSGNVSHEDVVHPIHSNPPALLWCRVCHSRQTQSTIGQENMGVVADHIPTTPQQSRQGEHRSGPFAKVQPATSSSWQQWGPLKASLQKLTVGQLDLLVAACHLLSLRCWSFTDQRPLTCTLPDIGFQQSCLDHVQVVIAMLVEIRRLIPFWKQLSDFHPRPHHPFLLNQFDPLTDPHSQAWSFSITSLTHLAAIRRPRTTCGCSRLAPTSFSWTNRRPFSQADANSSWVLDGWKMIAWKKQ